MIYQNPHILTQDRQVVVGGRYSYIEDGHNCHVEVLQDLSTSEILHFKLRVVDVPPTCAFKVGTEFDAYVYRHFFRPIPGMWKLYSLNEFCEVGQLPDGRQGVIWPEVLKPSTDDVVKPKKKAKKK